MKPKKPLKSPQELLWIEDLLPEGDYSRRFMFGGFAYYYQAKMILLTIEDSKTNSYKDQKFDYPVWNGCLFPVDRESHPAILKKFPQLIPHPVLPKWLYLPVDRENFEDEVTQIIKHVLKNMNLWGIIPKSKSKTNSKTKNSKAKTIKTPNVSKKDMATPQMFREDSKLPDLNRIQNITDLKNLGPSSEKILKKAGIKNGQEILKQGWKKTFIKVVKNNPKLLNMFMAAALIGATTNKEWFAIDPELKQEARLLIQELKKKLKK